MSHRLQQTAIAKLEKADDVFPHDREFLQAFIEQTGRELWEVLERISEGDADRAVSEAGYLAYLVQCTDIGKGGGLPIWYDMKPSEYQKAKADAVRRLRAVERELAGLVPGLEHVSMLSVLWPDGGPVEREIEDMDDVALNYWGKGAGLAVSKLVDFYERSFPEHCPTVSGENGAIEAICREIEKFEPRHYHKPRFGPAWPKHFVCQLFEQLNQDSGFAELTLADKYRLIEGCLDFYARWIGKPEDAWRWTTRRIEKNVTP